MATQLYPPIDRYKASIFYKTCAPPLAHASQAFLGGAPACMALRSKCARHDRGANKERIKRTSIASWRFLLDRVWSCDIIGELGETAVFNLAQF
jgi:hypothetical protein